MNHRFLRYAAWAAEYFFPTGCLICGASLLGKTESFLPVCSSCLTRLKAGRRRGSCCAVCGTPLTSEEGLCLRCRERSFTFHSHRSLYDYGGEIKTLLLAYKKGGYNALARLFADLLGETLLQDYPDIPVVPVPARPAALRQRGFDTTGLICCLLKKKYPVRVIPLLKRNNAKQQKTLKYAERILNLQGKFRLKKAPPFSFDRVVLLDDVFTTGATAEACSTVLKAGGLSRVDVLTLSQD
ncbi:MAG: ComF family protein [Spirochaetales bacterium]|nr:ComF family protein [Spirochaetales bacterium]